MDNLSPKENHILAYKLGAWGCILLMIYSLATILIVTLIGGPPESVEECFKMLKESRLNGLLRLDILTMFLMPLYYVLFFALYTALKEVNHTVALISTLFIFVGVTLFLSAPSVFSFLSLSDAYWLAETSSEKDQLRAAAGGLLATDIWHGTGPRIGGLLTQLGATLISILMLRSASFTKLTAYTGIITHGLDFLHVLIGFALPVIANGLMAVAGVLYLLWFPLITLNLLKLAKQ